MNELSRQLDEKVNQRIQTLGDMVVAYTDMMDRHDKGLLKDNKVNNNSTYSSYLQGVPKKTQL